MRDNENVNCDVAREALSARIDGERESVPSARVDEHLETCAECRDWFDAVAEQALALRRLAHSGPVLGVAGAAHGGRSPRDFGAVLRWALFAVGLAQFAVAAAQGLGLGVGLVHDHGMNGAGHLLNESTAWSIALGLVMLAAARWPVIAPGLACVLTAFVVVLTAYVVADAMSGAVTPVRVLTHLPVVLGAALALLVWRVTPTPRPAPDTEQHETQIRLPHNASRGRRRGHLWPTDDSAA